jgi:hypothetical protein
MMQLANTSQLIAPAYEPKRQNRFIITFEDLSSPVSFSAQLDDEELSTKQLSEILSAEFTGTKQVPPSTSQNAFDMLYNNSVIQPWVVKNFDYNLSRAIDYFGNITILFYDPVIPSTKSTIIYDFIPKIKYIRMHVFKVRSSRFNH